MTDVAAGEGLDFRFDLARGGNTFDAHRLLHLAHANGLQDTVKERLMRAYLGEGQAIGDPQVLERLGIEAGLPADEVQDVLATDRYAAEVRDDERTAAALGINAVPFFVVDRAIGASGAQPPEVLRELLERALPAKPVIPVLATGETCGPEGC
jgi:predicted DsbA family dithiol-disulfide isomerase